MPASLQAALIPLIVMALSALAVKLGLDAKDMQGNIYFLAAAIAGLLTAGYGTLLSWRQGKKIERAENLVPGVTDPKGPISPVTTILNDPTSPTPPLVINDLPPESKP